MKTITNYNRTPKLTLIGAGPGDPDLISVKGVKALQNARVVLYDALVAEQLLDYAPNAIKVYVGKRANKHTYPQEHIQKLIVQYALEYGHVVRLKGGDSFVFGRGTEEINFVQLYGIETEVVPGISSAFSVPAAVGIPATERGVAEGVWVITGTTTQGKPSQDIALAAQSNSTVVILMGVKNLPHIVEAYLQQGKEKLPVAVIQNGTTPAQRHVVGTVDNIVSLVKVHKIGSPAIIVVGEVVKNAQKLNTVVHQLNYN